jgi:hypothetical protein
MGLLLASVRITWGYWGVSGRAVELVHINHGGGRGPAPARPSYRPRGEAGIREKDRELTLKLKTTTAAAGSA